MSGAPKQTHRALTLREARGLASIAMSVLDGPSGGDTAIEALVGAALAERGRVEVAAPLAYEITAWRTTLTDTLDAYDAFRLTALKKSDAMLHEYANAVVNMLTDLVNEVGRRVESLQVAGGAAGVPDGTTDPIEAANAHLIVRVPVFPGDGS